jgi:hypothetical protein
MSINVLQGTINGETLKILYDLCNPEENSTSFDILSLPKQQDLRVLCELVAEDCDEVFDEVKYYLRVIDYIEL